MFSQEQFFQLWNRDPASTAYNSGFAMVLQGPLDVAALQAAAQLVFERQQVGCSQCRCAIPKRQSGSRCRAEPHLLMVDRPCLPLLQSLRTRFVRDDEVPAQRIAPVASKQECLTFERLPAGSAGVSPAADGFCSVAEGESN